MFSFHIREMLISVKFPGKYTFFQRKVILKRRIILQTSS